MNLTEFSVDIYYIINEFLYSIDNNLRFVNKSMNNNKEFLICYNKIVKERVLKLKEKYSCIKIQSFLKKHFFIKPYSYYNDRLYISMRGYQFYNSEIAIPMNSLSFYDTKITFPINNEINNKNVRKSKKKLNKYRKKNNKRTVSKKSNYKNRR